MEVANNFIYVVKISLHGREMIHAAAACLTVLCP